MSRSQANLLLVVTAVIWGFAFVAQKTGMDGIGPTWFTGFRFLLGAVCIIPFAFAEQRRNPTPKTTKSDIFGAVSCGLFLFLGAVCQQIGIVSTTVTNAGFLTALYVPFVPILTLVLWKKGPNWTLWPSFVGSLLGAYLLTGGELTAVQGGDAWVILGAFFWSCQVVALERALRTSQRPIFTATVQFISCGVLAMLVAPWIEPFSWQGVLSSAPELIYTGILSVGIAFTIQAIAQRHTPSADAAIIMSGEVVVAAIAGAWLQGDILSSIQMAGCGLVFVSIVSAQVLPMLKDKVAFRQLLP